MLSSEVLPAPFGPMIEAISPRRTENDISSTARTPPNRFDTAVAASSSSSAGFTNRRSSQDRLMRRGYGWHDADAITRMQPVTSLKGGSPWSGDQRSCRRGPRRGTIARPYRGTSGDKRLCIRHAAGDIADRVSRQWQNDAAAPRPLRPVLFRYRGHRQRDRRDPDRSLSRGFHRGQRPRAAGRLPVLHGPRGSGAEPAQPDRAARRRRDPALSPHRDRDQRAGRSGAAAAHPRRRPDARSAAAPRTGRDAGRRSRGRPETQPFRR